MTMRLRMLVTAACAAAALAASAVPPALGAASGPAFSGQVCTLLAASNVPHGVPATCRQGKPKATAPATTTYVGAWGASGLRLEIKVIAFTTAAARNAGFAEFKQEVSIFPKIGIPVSVVRVGSWARESVNPAAPTSVTVQFVAGGDDCLVFALGVPASEDATFKAETLAVAKAVAAKLT